MFFNYEFLICLLDNDGTRRNKLWIHCILSIEPDWFVTLSLLLEDGGGVGAAGFSLMDWNTRRSGWLKEAENLRSETIDCESNGFGKTFHKSCPNGNKTSIKLMLINHHLWSEWTGLLTEFPLEVKAFFIWYCYQCSIKFTTWFVSNGVYGMDGKAASEYDCEDYSPCGL